MGEKEGKKQQAELGNVIDLDKVRENEETALGRSSVGQIGKEVATRTPEDVARADEAKEEITNGLEDKEKTEEDKGLEDK